jgi:hypothetical protein
MLHRNLLILCVKSCKRTNNSVNLDKYMKSNYVVALINKQNKNKMSTNNNELEALLSQVREEEVAKEKEQKSAFKVDERVLQMKQGATYTGRFVPDLKNPKNNFVTYGEVIFPSKLDGSTVYGGRSPKDAGINPKDDLYNVTQWADYKKAKDAGDEPARKLACKLIPQRKQKMNFYLTEVKNDPDSLGKVGKVVVLGYAAQKDKEDKPSSDLYKKIENAIYGAKKDKIGGRALDLSAKGKSLTIVVGSKDIGGRKIPEYIDSEFEDAEDLGLSAEEIKKIHASAHNLSDFLPAVKTKEEIKQILDEHWFCKVADPEDSLTAEERPADDDDDIPGLTDESSTNVDDLIAGLD